MSIRYESGMRSNLFVFSCRKKKDSKKSKDGSFKSRRVLSHIKKNFYFDNADSTPQASFFFIWGRIKYQLAV